jgi:hypothetical protein
MAKVHKPEWISRAELARRKGVSTTAVAKACKVRLAPSCNGKRVDAKHALVVAWLEGTPHQVPSDTAATDTETPTPVRPAPGKRPISPPARRRGSDAKASSSAESGTDEDLEELAKELQPLVERFGTHTGFRDFLNALKTIEDIRGKRLDNEETEGRLIERELVRVHVFGAMETTHRQLLADLPKTLAQTLYANARSGVPLEESEHGVRSEISKVLQPMKLAAAKALRTPNA